MSPFMKYDIRLCMVYEAIMLCLWKLYVKLCEALF